MTRGIIIIAILLNLTILTIASTPSPSPSRAVTQESSTRPPPQILSGGPFGTPQPQASPAPTGAVGRFLGTCGFESPAFVTRCKKCCRQTRNRLSNDFPFLKSCNSCRLKRNLNPPRSGRCRQGTPLGFANAPSNCFYDRCYAMLAESGPCICLR